MPMTTFHLTTSHFDDHFPDTVSYRIKDASENRLVCYDLCNALSHNEWDIGKYDEILDVYLFESIINLGKFHRNYFKSGQDIPTRGLRKHVTDIMTESPTEWVRAPKFPQDFLPRLKAYAEKCRKHACAVGTWNHYRDIEVPFSLALYNLSRNGIKIDLKRIETIHSNIENAQQKLERALEINNLGGTEIRDLNAWIKAYDFDEYFPAGRNEISIKDLSLLEDQHQVFKIFLRFNKLKRIRNILKNFGDQAVIKPFYKTMGAVTGRCTSIKPNIMGIPKIFRPIVVPSQKNFGIVECDYSQMEVGVAAALSGDRNLIHDFNTGDVYERTGEHLFGNSSPKSRNKAKIIFLGIQYGMSKNTLAKRLGIGRSATSEILNNIYAKYSHLKNFLNNQEKLGEKDGFVSSISGLRRYRRYPNSKASYWEKNWFKNFPVQSSAATVFKRAIIKIHEQFKDEPFNLLVPLYDSVVFEAPLNQLSDITDGVKECMIESMTDYFPVLKPKVTVNDTDPSCWNSEGKSNSIETFLNDPLSGINIREKSSNNADWSDYFG